MNTAVVTAQPIESPTDSRLSHSRRLQRERKTMAAMIDCYCRDHHRPDAGVCPECQALIEYATLRLERCRFGAQKPTCANCPVHCYQTQRREQVRVVMRYAGPRMLWKHPILAMGHLLDGYRKAPSSNGRGHGR